jgi:hypothetical protein
MRFELAECEGLGLLCAKPVSKAMLLHALKAASDLSAEVDTVLTYRRTSLSYDIIYFKI